MAEEILIAELRAATQKWEQDLKRAARDADKAAKEINKDLGSIGDAVKSLPSEFKKFNETLGKVEANTRRLKSETEQASRSFLNLKNVIAGLGLAILARQAVDLSASLVRNAEALTGVQLGLTQALGSAQLAGEAFEFVRQEASRLAINTIDAAKSFTRLNNSVKNTALEGEGAKFIFQAFTESAVAMRLSQDELSRVFLQLNQAIARQKFETEDLNSITEAGIPVYRLLQETLGLTGTEFRKSLEQGKIGMEALILLSDRLRKEYGSIAETAAQTVPAQFRRMFDEIRTDAALFTQGLLGTAELQGLADDIKEIFKEIRSNINQQDVVDFFNNITKAARFAALGILDTVKAINAVSKFFSEAGNLISEGFKRLNEAAGLTGENLSTRIEDELATLDDAIDQTFRVNYPKAVEAGEREVAELQRRAREEQAKRAEEAAQVAAEKELKKFLRTQEQIARERIRQYQERLRAQEAADERRLKQERETIEKFKEIRERAAKDQEKLIKEEKENFDRIFDRAADNIQDAFADLISDALQGDLPRIQDFANSVQSIFANMAASIVTEEFIKPLLKDALKSAKGLFAKDGSSSGVSGLDIGTIAGGAGLGIGVGSTASRVLGGSREGATASGALGGAVAGAYIGSSFGPYGTAAGAIIGAIAGGAGGFFSAPSEKTSFADLQTVGRGGPFPRAVQDQARVSTPFGDIGVGGKRIESGDFLNAVAEFDRQIARLLPETLKDRVEEVFRQVDNSTRAKSEGAALSKIVQQRAFDAVAAVLGEDVANTVAGPRGQVSSSGIQTVQARVAEALGIVRTIEEFKIGPLSDVGEAIKAVNDRFNDLVISAEAFGIGTDEIIKERDRLLAEITSDVNADIQQRILEIVDPAAAQFAALAKRQEEDLKRAKDAGANIAEVERLHALERKKLAEELADAGDEVNDSLDDTARRLEALRAQMTGFIRGGLSPAAQQLAALDERFKALHQEALELGEATGELVNSYAAQRTEIIRQSQRAINQAILQITDPFAAAIEQIHAQIKQFQKDVDAGLISRARLDDFINASFFQARYQQAVNIAGGGAQTPQAQFDELVRSFISAGSDISATERELDALAKQFTQLRDALTFLGLPTDKLTESYHRQFKAIKEAAQELDQTNNDALAAQNRVFDIIRGVIAPTELFFSLVNREIQELITATKDFVSKDALDRAADILRSQRVAEEALNRIGGGGKTAIEQVADNFDAFIQAGHPLSAAGQALFDLTENFLNLVDAADLLGLSTADLEASYLDQAAAIRENLIAEIDASLEPRRQVVKQAEDFLNRLRVGDELPNNLRVDEARLQFQRLLNAGDLAAAIQAGDTLHRIAREAFGSTSRFFDLRNEVFSGIEEARLKEEAAIEAEKQRLLKEEGRQLELINLQRNSLDSLQRIQSSNNDVARGIEQLIKLIRGQNDTSDRIESLLRQVLA